MWTDSRIEKRKGEYKIKLKGKTAIITGAAGYIGREIAICLASEGAAVVVCDINIKRAELVKKEIVDAGGHAMTSGTDVRNSKQVGDLVADVLKQYGRIDILVNNAGGSGALLKKLTPFYESEESTWDFVLDLNLKGTFICTRAVLDTMMEQRSGKIVNLGSVAGVSGLMRRADYSAAKGGIIAFTKTLAMELGPFNINVNCVSPGALPKNGGGSYSGTYLGRSGKPEEVAALILFLVSNDSDFITGQNYIIDGGRTLGVKG